MTKESRDKIYLRQECVKIGWICKALSDDADKAWPDRCIIGPWGRVAWIEVKASGSNHSKEHLNRQKKKLAELTAMGHIAAMVKGRPAIDAFLRWLQDELKWPVLPPGSHLQPEITATRRYIQP